MLPPNTQRGSRVRISNKWFCRQKRVETGEPVTTETLMEALVFHSQTVWLMPKNAG